MQATKGQVKDIVNHVFCKTWRTCNTIWCKTMQATKGQVKDIVNHVFCKTWRTCNTIWYKTMQGVKFESFVKNY
jgi:ribosomal protein L23